MMGTIIIISKAVHEQIVRHGERAYPDECCGLLLGLQDGNCRFVHEPREVENAAANSSHNRYLIAPERVFEADCLAQRKGWDIIGVYHSHPDHPSRPSEFDCKNAILDYSYLILAVEKGRAGELSCWTLHGRKFVPEALRIAG